MGELAENIDQHVLDAQWHLTILTRRVCENIRQLECRSEIALALAELTANLSNLEDLSCDVRELEERLRRDGEVPPPGPGPIDFAEAKVRLGTRRSQERRRQR